MRVMYLTMNPNRASTTVATEGWFRLLPARGLQPVLVSKAAGAFHEWTLGQGIPASIIPLPVPNEVTPTSLARALWPLWRLARRHKIQMVHCNEQDIYPVGQRLGRLLRVPVVVSVHCRMDRGFCTWAFRRNRQPARMFFVSNANREACREGLDGLLPESLRRVLHNAIDLDHFAPDPGRRLRFREQHGLTANVAIGVACALREWKQLDHLIDAAAPLTDSRLRVVIAGGPYQGEEAYAEGFLRRARERLGGRLITLGHLSELRDFYNGLDVFVNTSREEAGSISVIESLACGCPIVGYPSGAVREQILPSGGEIVAQDDRDALSAALARYVAEPAPLASLRAGARQAAEERFDIQVASERLWAEYLSLVPPQSC